MRNTACSRISENVKNTHLNNHPNRQSYFLLSRLTFTRRTFGSIHDLPKRRLGCCFKEPTRTGLGVILISGNGGAPNPFLKFAQWAIHKAIKDFFMPRCCSLLPTQAVGHSGSRKAGVSRRFQTATHRINRFPFRSLPTTKPTWPPPARSNTAMQL